MSLLDGPVSRLLLYTAARHAGLAAQVYWGLAAAADAAACGACDDFMSPKLPPVAHMTRACRRGCGGAAACERACGAAGCGGGRGRGGAEVDAFEPA